MPQIATLDPYATFARPGTLTIKRLIAGPVDDVWENLTDGELRRHWFAAGAMEMKVGGCCEFVRRNDELTDPPGKRPDGIPAEIRTQSEVTMLDPPSAIAFTFGDGMVSIELAPKADRVQLTLVHSGLPNHTIMVRAASSWHMHLDILTALIERGKTEPFWDGWKRLRDEYGRRLLACDELS
ncbi:MAG: SRPBCC family protein [Devosia sp.]